MSLRIAHLSDPHFGTEVPAVRDALLAELNATPPDLVILTGDITQRARRAQFRRAREFLASLPPRPRVCLPGNHDLPLFDLLTRFTRPYARFRHYVSPQLEPEYLGEQVAVLCVDGTSPKRHKDGAIAPGVVARTAARLGGLSQPFRIVATHQPLAAADPGDLANVMHGARQALDGWIGAGADLFLGGHIHLPYCLPVRSADAARTGVLLQAGTCISHRTRAHIPNSYNAIVLEHTQGERRMHIERRDFDAASGRFTVHTRHVARSLPATAADMRPSGWQLA